MSQLTARTKGTLVSWDQWRSAQAELQGRKKPKAAVTTAEKYVKNNKLTPFVTRTTGNGSFFAINLETGEEVQFKITITNSGGRVKYYHAGMSAGDHNVTFYAINGVDVELQRKLVNKFHNKSWNSHTYLNVDAIRYCNDNPEFAERLLSDDVPSSIFANRGYEGIFYQLSFETLANNHSLLDRPMPTLESVKPIDVLGCPYEVSVWCEQYIGFQLRKVTDYGYGLRKPGPLALLINRMWHMRTLLKVVVWAKALINKGYFTLEYLQNKYPEIAGANVEPDKKEYLITPRQPPIVAFDELFVNGEVVVNVFKCTARYFSSLCLVRLTRFGLNVSCYWSGKTTDLENLDTFVKKIETELALTLTDEQRELFKVKTLDKITKWLKEHGDDGTT